MTTHGSNTSLLALTARIVEAHVKNNEVEVAELARLIADVYRAVAGHGAAADASRPPTPAVPVAESITPQYLICLENGKKLKMLKRHLMRAFNMTPADYRARWNLPGNYPMVAPNYAKRRSVLAKNLGFGKHSGRSAGAKQPARARIAKVAR